MPTILSKTSSPADLRKRAQSRIARPVGLDGSLASDISALRVLHDMAASSETAPNALAVLHELQVHQVELDLQAEELRNAIVELEAIHERQLQLFHSAPVGYLVIDAQTRILDCNATAARQLSESPGCLLGRRLDRFFTETSQMALKNLLVRSHLSQAGVCVGLDLSTGQGAKVRLAASATIDPSGMGYLLVLSSLPELA